MDRRPGTLALYSIFFFSSNSYGFTDKLKVNLLSFFSGEKTAPYSHLHEVAHPELVTVPESPWHPQWAGESSVQGQNRPKTPKPRLSISQH